MSNQYISEIRVFSFAFPPKGWALCNGQLLPIAQNQALFSLLGTTYGGDGETTFGLPNLQARVPLHVGGGYNLGSLGGEATVSLTLDQIPAHTHVPVASAGTASTADPSKAYWASTTPPAYATSSGAAMDPQAIAAFSGGLGHQNMSPYLTLSFCIALIGIFPSRN